MAEATKKLRDPEKPKMPLYRSQSLGRLASLVHSRFAVLMAFWSEWLLGEVWSPWKCCNK